ncbi:MAG TPA: helix-turn-helix domain-containing protein [Euzebya sp.]|nr:helix-turn-helix domain-containing protein [Euzebya sp.]
MLHPDDLFDREHEWRDLHAFVAGVRPGVQLGILRGRRRQGKSFLLRRLARSVGGLYHQAVRSQPAQALEALGATLGAHLGVPCGQVALRDWDAALEALFKVPVPVVILDEFPYLLAHSPELATTVQKHIDAGRDSGPPVRLILCGSALSVMAQLLGGQQALRGRAVMDLSLGPFDYRLAARYHGIDDPATALRVDAVLGGTPGYRDLAPAAPNAVEGLSDWLAAGVLNPSSALFREDDYLLAEEQTLTDRGLYHAVLRAVADGATTVTQVAAALGRDKTGVGYPLRSLEAAGFISRTEDALRRRRPIYRVADPIVRFHHVITRPDLARFEDRRTAEAWQDALPRFSGQILGPHFEHLAREFIRRHASAAMLGGAVATVGPAVINDARARRTHELDVVVHGRAEDGGAPLLAIGEAKHTSRQRGLADLRRLEHIRGLLESAGHRAASDARLLLFSAAGFDADLATEVGRRADAAMIDLDQMYHLH